MTRIATPNDLEFITHLAHEFDPFGPYVTVFVNMLIGNHASLRRLGVIGDVELFIHEDDAVQRTGFAAVEWSINGTGNIHGVAVDERYRGQGFATHLLNHVEQLASQRGTLTLEAITAETNIPALSCFTNFGFHNLGFKGNYPNGQRAVLLRKTVE
jgi:ribosomal protein S18 acetylase RimI-like enzyme